MTISHLDDVVRAKFGSGRAGLDVGLTVSVRVLSWRFRDVALAQNVGRVPLPVASHVASRISGIIGAFSVN
jgi:hypothetical protein